MLEDITKTGPVGLRGLKGISAGKEAEEAFKNLSSEEAINSLPRILDRENSSLRTAKNLGQFTPIRTGADYGSSMFDKDIMGAADVDNVANLRAENQSAAAQIGAGALKFGSTAVTTFLDGTLGSLVGLAQGIDNLLDNDPKTTFRNGLWNNDFNKWMAAAQEKMEEIAPNYYTEEQLNSPWYSAANLLSANFWGDKFLKNMGFTAGALATMAVPGFDMAWLGKGISTAGRALNFGEKALKGVDKAGKLVSRVGNTLISAHGEASIEAINATKDNLDAEIRNLGERRNEAIRAATEEYERNKYRIPQEGELNPYDAYMAELDNINNDYNTAVQEAEKGIINVGNSVYLANLALLSLTNNLEFGKYLKGGYNTQKGFMNLDMLAKGEKTESLKEFGKAMAKGEAALQVSEELGKNKVGKIIGGTVARMAEEGFEEGSQRLISDSAQMQEQARLNVWAKKTDDSFYAKGINPDVTDELVDKYKALYHAWNTAFGDISSTGWEEVFLGALTGGIGTFNVKKSREGKRGFGMQGGIWEEIAGIKERQQDAEKFVSSFNDAIQKPEFRERARHAITAMSLTEEMDHFLRVGDVLQYKNKELAQIVNDALFFKNNGALDAYKSFYEAMKDEVSDDDLLQVREQLQTMNGKSPYDGMNNEELRKVLKDKASSTLEKIDKALEIHDNHTLKYTEKALKEAQKVYEGLPDANERANSLVQNMMLDLTAQATTIWDLERRKQELQSELDSMSDADKLVRGVTTYTSAIDKINKQIDARSEAYKNNTSNLENYVHTLKRYDDFAAAKRVSKDAESFKNALKGVTTLKEIGDIYMASPFEDKQAVFDEAVNETEGDTKNLLEQFQPFITVLNSYQDAIIKAIDEEIPSLPEDASEEDKQRVAEAKLSWALGASQLMEGLLSDYVENEDVSYTKDTLTDAIKGLSDSFEDDEAINPEIASVKQIYKKIFNKVADTLKNSEVPYKAAEPRKKKSDKKEASKKKEEPKKEPEKKEEPKESPEVPEGSAEGKDIDLDILGDRPPRIIDEEAKEEKPAKLYITDKKTAKSYIDKYLKKRFGDKVERFKELIDKDSLTDAEDKELDEFIGLASDNFRKMFTSEDKPEVKETSSDDIKDGSKVSKPVEEDPNQLDDDKEDAQKNGLSARANGFVKYAVGTDKNPGIADGVGRELSATNPSSAQWYSYPFAEGIDYIVNNYLYQLMSIKGNDGKLKVQYAMYYPNGVQAVGVTKRGGKAGIPHVLLVTEYTDAVKKILPESNPNIQNNIIQNGKYLIVGSYGYSTGQKKLEEAQLAIIERITSQREKDNSYETYEVLKPDGDKWVNYIYDISPGAALRKNTSSDSEYVSVKTVFDNNNPTGAKAKDLKFTVVEGNEEEGTVNHKHIRINPDDRIYDTEFLHHPGQVIMWVPTATGVYMPEFIAPLTFKDLTERNGKVYSDIMNILDRIASTDPSDTNAIEGLFGALRGMLIFGAQPGNQIFYDSRETDAEGGINLGYNTVRAQSLGDFKDKASLFLGSPISKEEKVQSLVNMIEEINPRVAINLRTLRDNPEYYVDSNVLLVQLRNWGTVNAKAYMYVPNTDGTIKEPQKAKSERQNRRASATVDGAIWASGVKYLKMSDGTYTVNSMVGSERAVVTDANILQVLDDVSQATKENAIVLKIGSVDVPYWVFGSGDNIRVYAKQHEVGFQRVPSTDSTYKDILKKAFDSQKEEETKAAIENLEATKKDFLEDSIIPEERKTPTPSQPEKGKTINGQTTEGRTSLSEQDLEAQKVTFESLLLDYFLSSDENAEKLLTLFGTDSPDAIIEKLEANPHTKGLYMNVHSIEDFEQLLDKYEC